VNNNHAAALHQTNLNNASQPKAVAFEKVSDKVRTKQDGNPLFSPDCRQNSV